MLNPMFRALPAVCAACLLAAPVPAGAQAFAPSEEDEDEEKDEVDEAIEAYLEEDDEGEDGDDTTLTPPSVIGGDETYDLEGDEDLDDLDDDLDEDDVEEGDEDIFGDDAEDLIAEATAEKEAEQETEWAEETTKFFEASGYFRMRIDMFHKFSMGYKPDDGYMPFPLPLEANPNTTIYSHLNECSGDGKKPKWCKNQTLGGANIRLRFNPIINLSENVRILSSFDILDNLVLGSIPENSGAMLGLDPDTGGTGFVLTPRNPWVPLEAFASTQEGPSWRNTLQNAIYVRSVWGEVLFKNVGMLKFGRMPSHWGMGMFINEGAGLDSDYGDIADRIMFATKLFNVILAVGWDWPASGPTSMKWSQQSGKAYDVSQVDDVNQWLAVVAYKQEREEEERLLSLGKPVFSTGLYAIYRNQVLSTENWNVPGASDDNIDMVERNAWAVIGDLWFKVLYQNFRLELEAVIIGGKIDNIEQDNWLDDGYDVLQWGYALEFEQSWLDGSLFVQFKTGYASGDSNVEGISPADGLLVQNAGKGDHRISAFRFDPDYNIDLILFEEILGSVTAAYYFRPSIGYWILKNQLVAQLDIVYSLASEPVSTRGNSPHLGLEFDLTVKYMTKDHFVAMLQYAYLIPLKGFETLKGVPGGHRNLSHPQTLQVFLGVTY